MSSNDIRGIAAVVVGVVVGYVTESPQAGFAAAGLVYGVTAPDTRVEGPKLADLKAPAASYGAVIPYLEGAPRVAGIYAWYSDKRAVPHESSSGKGGPSVNTTLYTYEMDALIELSINQLAGVRKIYSNGKLIWSADGDADNETLAASANTNSWRHIRFYDGNDTQLPDPVYETAVGIGNAPAYRGRFTVFIEGLNLGQSGQLPVLTFEVVSEGTFSLEKSIEIVYEVGLDSVSSAGSGVGNFVGGGGHTWYVGNFGPAFTNKNFITTVYDPTLPAPGVETTYLGVVPNVGTTVNFLTGLSDESYYIVSGIASLTITTQDSTGAVFPSNYPTNPTDRFVSMGTYARYHGVTLGLLIASPFIGLATLGGAFESTAYLPHCATFFDGNWYVMPHAADGLVYYYDGASLAALGTIADPRGNTGANGGAIVTDVVTEEMYLMFGATLYKWSGTAWDVYLATLPTELQGMDLAVTPSGITMYGGALYSLHHLASGGDPPFIYRLSVARPADTITEDAVFLDQVVRRLCLRTGLLTDDDIDVTELASDRVRALAITQVGPTRSTLEILMAAFTFEATEAGKIRFVKRGGAPALTIPFERLGASTGDSVEPLPLRRLNDLELPARVTIRYANVFNDFQDGSESGDRLVTQSTAEQVVEFPLGFTPEEAKRVADVFTMDLAVSLLNIGPVAVPNKYAALEPTDVVILTGRDGSTYRARIEKVTAADGVNTFELVLDDATVVNSLANTSSDYTSSNLIREVSLTAQLPLDTAIWRDADNDTGFYELVKPVGTKWAGATILSSRDGVSYASEGGITSRAIFGTCMTTLNDWTGPRVFDEFSTVTVNVGLGELSSSTRDAILNDQTINACVVGVDGRWEIMQFRTADLLSDGVYMLSGFLRGGRGTEWAMTGHVIGEKFAILQAAGMRRIPVETTFLGIERFYKAVSVGRDQAPTGAQAFTDFGIGMKPFSPFDGRALLRDAVSGDVTLSWQRRTRLSMRAIGPLGISLPLGEGTEAYAIDIYDDNTYTTVVRTFNTTAAFVVYSGVLQTTDFGSPQSTIYFTVQQISEAVGRGYALQAAA